MSYEQGYWAYPPPAPQTDQKAVWAPLSAIAGFVLRPVILHVVGLVLANQSLDAIARSQGALTGDGLARVARILSIIGLVLTAVGVLFFLAVVAVA